jgi:hypothetical protein
VQIVFVVANMLPEQMAEAAFAVAADPPNRLDVDLAEAKAGFALKGFGGCLVGSAAATGALLAAPLGDGAEQASRIIDRTVLCRTVGVGYPDSVRFATVWAEPFQHLGGAPAAPWLFVGNRAGGDDPGVSASIRTGPYGNDANGFVSLSRTRCTRTSVRVPLSSSGLRGGPTQPFGDNYRCDLPATVLIRVRVDFKRPTALRPDTRSPSVLIARGHITTGYLAVATARGRKPIVFASAHDASGKARLFVAPSRCRAEP